MRLLLINPNTTVSITEKVADFARSQVRRGTKIDAVSGRFGAAYIAARAPYAIAAHAALDAFATHFDRHDAVILACFGDPGLDALREISEVPVIGLAEASLHCALQAARRVGIVTGGAMWEPMLWEFARSRGLAERIAAIRTVAPSGADIARDPQAALADLANSCDLVARDGADCVILGGAGLVGLAAHLQDRVKVPLIDCVAAGLRQAEALAGLVSPPQQGGVASEWPAVASIGLSAPLRRLMLRQNPNSRQRR